MYPRSNQALFAEIVRDHVAVSQFPVGERWGRHSFSMRNRTMALLSDATIYWLRSGGKRKRFNIQGWEAIRLGRPLFCSSHWSLRVWPGRRR